MSIFTEAELGELCECLTPSLYKTVVEAVSLPELPCCQVHENLLRSGKIKAFDNCIVCTRNHRDELQTQLNTAMALARDFHETCIAVMGREGWQSGRNRDEMMACGRKYWKLKTLLP